jgi:hypothetical protein
VAGNEARSALNALMNAESLAGSAANYSEGDEASQKIAEIWAQIAIARAITGLGYAILSRESND